MINTIEQKVTSLELSKRLKELGVKQESYFYYVDGDLWDKTAQSDYEMPSTPSRDKWISAFLAEELGELLKKVDFNIWYSYPDWRLKLSDDIETRGRDESLTNAMAEMIIYLKKQNLI